MGICSELAEMLKFCSGGGERSRHADVKFSFISGWNEKSKFSISQSWTFRIPNRTHQTISFEWSQHVVVIKSKDFVLTFDLKALWHSKWLKPALWRMLCSLKISGIVFVNWGKRSLLEYNSATLSSFIVIWKQLKRSSKGQYKDCQEIENHLQRCRNALVLWGLVRKIVLRTCDRGRGQPLYLMCVGHDAQPAQSSLA